MNSLYHKDQCQSQESTRPSLTSSFAAAVAAGMEQNTGKGLIIYSKGTLFEKAKCAVNSSSTTVVRLVRFRNHYHVLSSQMWQVSICLKIHGQLHPSPSPVSSDTTPPKQCATYHQPPRHTAGEYLKMLRKHLVSGASLSSSKWTVCVGLYDGTKERAGVSAV